MYINIQQDATIISWFYYKISHVLGICCTHHQEHNSAVGSHWYNILRWIVKCMVTSTLKVVHSQAVCHITVVELELVYHGNVINRPILYNL
jgi:hypothetical protein